MIFKVLPAESLQSECINNNDKWVDVQKNEYYFGLDSNKNNCMLSENLVVTSPSSSARLVNHLTKKIQRNPDNSFNIRNIACLKHVFSDKTLTINSFPYSIEYYVYMMRHIII